VTRGITALGVALLLSACSSQVALTIDSEPPGAEVYEGDQLYGVTPITLNYEGDDEYREGGCMSTRPISVKWSSGAQARVSTINLCSSQPGDPVYTFDYPEGFDESAAGEDVGAPKRRVAPNGQLYYTVSHAPTEQEVYCYTDIAGDRVRTNCS
jgi:hypothetical protein